MLTDESLMPFGQYKGEKMCNVPADYLDWFAGQEARTDAAHDVQYYILANRSAINNELERLGIKLDAALDDGEGE